MNSEQKTAINNSIARTAMLLKQLKIEAEFMKGQVKIPFINKIYSDNIRVASSGLNDLMRLVKDERKAEVFMDDERALTMYSINQFLTNRTLKDLQLIETEFYKVTEPILSEM